MHGVPSINLCEPDYRDKFFIHGNSCLGQADVICVIDDPLSPSVRWENAWLVNQIWYNHSLLVGFVESGKQVYSYKQEITKDLKGMKFVKGWDLASVIQMKKEFDQHYDLISKFEKKLKEGRTHAFSPDKPKFLNLLALAGVPRDKQMETATEIRALLLLKDMFFTFESCIKSYLRKAQFHHDQTCAARYMKIFRERQAKLIETIEDEWKTGQKIIVFLESHQALDGELYQFLLTKRCVALSSTSLPPYFQDMKKLWGEKVIPHPVLIHATEENVDCDTPPPSPQIHSPTGMPEKPRTGMPMPRRTNSKDLLALLEEVTTLNN